MIEDLLNTYEVKNDGSLWYVEAIPSCAKTFIGIGAEAENKAKELADRWNNATEEYRRKKN